MATKSNNTQGNPYHDEQTGEFTSAENNAVGKEENNVVEKVKVNDTEKTIQPVSKLKFKLKGNIEDIRNNLKISTQVSSIPFLSSSYDVEEHLEEFFTDDIIKSIDSYFGKFRIPYKYFNLRTDPNERCGVNIFAACIGKKRWPNNYIKIIDNQEYNHLIRDYYNFTPLYRGITGNDTQFETIANSYSSKENEMIYGSVGGVAYGIAVYASNRRSEARSYANGYDNHIMDLVLNRKARTMSYSSIRTIRDELSSRKKNLIARVEKIFLDNGIEPTKAKNMANSFGITIDDEGFVAMLCGVEWYSSGTYHMIENLGALYRKLK